MSQTKIQKKKENTTKEKRKKIRQKTKKTAKSIKKKTSFMFWPSKTFANKFTNIMFCV